jgi:hypothetical protein
MIVSRESLLHRVTRSVASVSPDLSMSENMEVPVGFPRRREHSIGVYDSTGQKAHLRRGSIVYQSSAADVSARVEMLIARHYRGDKRTAARRLGIGTDGLSGLLSGDWGLFSLDALSAVVNRHGVSIEWLLGNTEKEKRC